MGGVSGCGGGGVGGGCLCGKVGEADRLLGRIWRGDCQLMEIDCGGEGITYSCVHSLRTKRNVIDDFPGECVKCQHVSVG